MATPGGKQERITKQARYKWKHKAIGLCVECSSPAEWHDTRCAKHRHGDRIRFVNNRVSRKQDNKCVRCTGPLDPDADTGFTTCINCREKHRDIAEVYR